MTYFTALTIGFIPSAWKDDGTYTAETWPKDAVLLTDEESLTYWKVNAPDGKQLSVTAEGRPCWIDAPQPEPVNATRIKRAQGKTELVAAHLFDTVKLWIDDPATPELARIGFYDQEDWVITDEFVQLAKTKMKLTDKQLQDLFNSAAVR